MSGKLVIQVLHNTCKFAVAAWPKCTTAAVFIKRQVVVMNGKVLASLPLKVAFNEKTGSQH